MININNIEITPNILNKIAKIDEFKGNWSANSLNLSQSELNVMKRVATIESVGSSNRIEGNKLSDKEIEELFNNINKKSFTSIDEEEVKGYADLINLVFDDYNEIPLTENYIKGLHKILLRYSKKDERHLGEYKKDSNRVVAYDEKGKEIGTIFETATPFDTPFMMTKLVSWLNDSLNEKLLHPIIIIGIFIVHFLSIHPFTDGNGRLSRVLTVLLMLKCNYTYMPYTSMESIIEASKDAYYRALRNTQKTIFEDKVDYEPWLTFFVTSLEKQIKVLTEKINLLKTDNKNKDASNSRNLLSSTSSLILDLFSNNKTLTISEIVNLTSINIETTRKAVQKLVKEGFLIKLGTTKSARYKKSK